MVKIAIGIGSNLGDRLKFIGLALERLSQDCLIEMSVSQIYETAPWGILEQPPFLNAVAVGKCEWKPPAVLNFLKQLEGELGRKQRVRFGPREIDLDLLAYGDLIYEDEQMIIPHLGLPTREFVLRPLCDVWSEWRHPGFGKSAVQMLEEVLQTGHPDAKVFSPPLPDRESLLLEELSLACTD